jgi:polyisoprenoid-binding protein YceI
MSMSMAGPGFPRRGRLAAWLLSGSLLLGLSGCQTSPPPEPEALPVPTVAPEVPADSREYKVVGEESLLQILVYRGGPMAKLGHNHVIASHHLEGSVYYTEDVVRSRFDIRIPVNQLTIDEPAMREAAGPDFPASVPQSARDGTRKNMLSDALLDGETHPVIRLRGTGVKVGADPLIVDVEITLKGRTHAVSVPVQFQKLDGALVAKGEFALKQSELGLKPFSVAMGTLVVLDEMRVRFEVVAR